MRLLPARRPIRALCSRIFLPRMENGAKCSPASFRKFRPRRLPPICETICYGSPEVRASAARALAHTEFGFAFPALAALSEDPQWFVRLRAVTALGEFADAGAMPVMLRALCDRNRLVRQRAAEALARIPDSISVLQGVLETRDSYALQALIAELDRAGNFARVSELLESGANRLTHAESLRLLRALETGAEELRAMMHIPANQKRLQTA